MLQAQFKRTHLKAKRLCACLGLISLCLLTSAFYFQFVEGLAPCKLCNWQRWPHGFIILFALLSITALRGRIMLIGIGVASFIGTGIAVYHSGIELHLWSGPGGCTADISSSASTSQLLDNLLETHVVRCDEISWSLLTLSMANWNALISFIMTVVATAGFYKLK